MTFIYVQDILPIIITAIIFSLLATLHRVLLPNQYSSFIQFKGEEDEKRSVQSTGIRILYLMGGSLFLHVIGFSTRQILLGIFVACFLNVWPAIIEYHLLKLNKPKIEWLLLLGYVCFIGFSMLVGYVTLNLLLPSFTGEDEAIWLSNSWISIIVSIFLMILPIPTEALIARFTHVVMEEKIDTFEEEVLIIERELNIKYPRIERNKHTIDETAKTYNINPKLLTVILKLEIFYRDRIYYSVSEKLLCTVFKSLAIKIDASIGIAQIKISTAEKILNQDPLDFIGELPKDKFNIDLCGRYLHNLIEEYNNSNIEDVSSDEGCNDIYNFIARMYLGSAANSHKRTVLIYSAVLRSVLSDNDLAYTNRIEYSNDVFCK